MATKFRLRRSATADKRPVESDLLLGELALNTYDGRLYTKRDTNNVGIADTAALLTPWTESFGGESIYYVNSVGIGTTNPETRLHVSDGHLASADNFDSNIVLAISKNTTTSSWAGLALNSGNAAGAFIHFGDTDDSNVGRLDYNHTDNCFSFFTNGNTTERIRIDSSGRILIGTTTEGHTSADDLTIASTGGVTGITIRSDNDEGGRIFFSDGTNGDAEYEGVIGYDHTNNHMYFSTNHGEKLRIDSDGKVGIGTDDPDEILHLGQLGTAGNNYNEGRLKIGGFPGTGYGFLVGYDNRGSGRGNIVNANNSGGNANRINIGFGAITASGAPTTEVLTLNQLGRVGIGSAIPDYMLDVSGAINSETDVKVGGISVSETALNDAVAMAIALG